MKSIITLLVVVSVVGVWGCASDKEGSDAWIEILRSFDTSGVTIDCSDPRDYSVSILMLFHPHNDSELWAHLTRVRVSSFRTDGGSNVPGTFDQHVDFYLAPEEPGSLSVIVLYEEQFYDPPLSWLCTELLDNESLGFDPETGEQIISGYFVI